MSVARASRLLANALQAQRGSNLSIGTMLAGYESDKSPPRIFYVDSSGMRIEGDMFAVGSGSTYAQGILDTEHHSDLTDAEAIALGIKAIRHVTQHFAMPDPVVSLMSIGFDRSKAGNMSFDRM